MDPRVLWRDQSPLQTINPSGLRDWVCIGIIWVGLLRSTVGLRCVSNKFTGEADTVSCAGRCAAQILAPARKRTVPRPQECWWLRLSGDLLSGNCFQLKKAFSPKATPCPRGNTSEHYSLQRQEGPVPCFKVGQHLQRCPCAGPSSRLQLRCGPHPPPALSSLLPPPSSRLLTLWALPHKPCKQISVPWSDSWRP